MKVRGVLTVLAAMAGLGLAGAPQAAAAPVAPPTSAEPLGVLGGCTWYAGCGTAVNSTGRGFHVTLNWGAPWNDTNVKWVAPWSTYGGNGVDVDGIYVGNGCTMSGIIDGRPGLYRYPFVWGAGWHKVSTNETAFVAVHSC